MRLAPLNLTFEAWLYHPQLMELADLAMTLYPQPTRSQQAGIEYLPVPRQKEDARK